MTEAVSKVKFSLAEIEAALDTGQIKARSPHIGSYGRGSNFWSCRRNGKTRLWKTRPNEFEIPVKIGFRSHGYIRHDSWIGKPGCGAGPDFMLNSMCGGQVQTEEGASK